MRECPRCESCYEDDVEVCPTDDAKTKQTLPGSRLLSSRYLLEKRLGRGAMGQVYLARDQNLVTRRVAVKTVRPDILNDEDLQEGESLYQLLRREGTLDLQRTITILGQAVAGVEAAHDEGILHRDLKPANIFLMQKRKPAGGSMSDGLVKVGDFGLAKIVTADRSDATSESGPQSRGIIGTPEYMAPEQMQTGVTLDTRADIYALGAIAYHMLGGRPPFIGDLAQLVAQKLMQAPPPLSSLRSDIPVEVEKAIMHALAREPQGRPQNAAEGFEELDTAGRKRPETPSSRDSPLIVMAPQGSEVYVDDERHGNVGRSGRVVLRSIVPGQHVLRVARAGEVDDERIIEVRADGIEQIIQAQFKSAA